MRKEKSLLLNAMTNVIEGSKSLVLTSYDKMDANVTANFRGMLREAGGSFTVVKKKMFLKAAETLGFNFGEELEGHIGVITVQDQLISAAKVLYKFSNEHENLIRVLGGQFEGKLCTPQEIEMISKLPTQDEMRSQFLSVLEAPMSHTLSVIEEYLKTVMHVAAEQANEES